MFVHVQNSIQDQMQIWAFLPHSLARHMCLIKCSFQLSAKNAAKRQPQKSKKMIHKTKTHKQYKVIHFHYEALSREYQRRVRADW